MKNAAVVLGLGSIVLVALAAQRSVAGEASYDVDGYWDCRNIPIEKTAYFSAIFEANADPGVVAAAFAQMLAAKYGYQGRANCGVSEIKGPAILAKARGDQASYAKQLRESQVKVFLTGWVYAGASASAPTPAATSAPVTPVATAATSDSPTKLWVCRGNANAPSRDMYITKPFAAGYDLTTQRKMQPALAQYMQAHYKPTVMTCDYYATQAEADARVTWLVNWAHTYKFDHVPVTFTYP